MSDRVALALAALANAAIPGLQPVSARRLPTPVDDVDVASVGDNLKRHWVVRRPRTAAASARLDQEASLLRNLTGLLPFAVPQVGGVAALRDGRRAVVHRRIPGEPLQLGSLVPGPGATAAVGRAIAAIHDLPLRVIEDAGLPAYQAAEYRQRRLAEVDRAAGTGQVPAPLLARWEQALEEAGAWRFVPCPVHGDLAADSILLRNGEVSGILDWAEARVADPADDLGWLAVGTDSAVFESAIEAYSVGRREAPDPHLARRARLAGELAVARWLLHGVALEDASIVDDATRMLSELEQSTVDHPW